MDGSLKIPVRILEPAAVLVRAGKDARPLAFATALWLRFLMGRRDDGEAYSIHDPAEPQLRAAVAEAGRDVSRIYDCVLGGVLANALPPELSDGVFRRAVEACLQRMFQLGVSKAIRLAAGAD